MPRKRKFPKNKKSEKSRVVIDFMDYEKIMKNLKELETKRTDDAAKSSASPALPFPKTTGENKRSRK